MRRGRGLLALVFILAGCAPSQVLGPAPSAAPDPDQAALTITRTTPAILTFAAGLATAYDVRVQVDGKDLRVNAPKFCQVDRQSIVCTVPELPKGGNFILPMTGSNISAVAQYKRGNGRSYTSEARQ